MATVTKRLVVHSAAIPTGETCDGCHYYRDVLRTCCDSTLGGRDTYPGSWQLMTDGNRLPECKARDRFLVVEPGSTAGELLLAAVALRNDEPLICSLECETVGLTSAVLCAGADPAVRAWVEANK